MLRSLGIFLVGLAIAGSAHAELVAYWDFNGDWDRSAGTSGIVTAGYLEVGVPGGLGYGVGTELNRLDSSFEAGQSLRFHGLATIVEHGYVEISGLNMTGLSSPTLSFAIEADSIFTGADTFKLQYNLGSGWQDITMPKPTAEYSVLTYTFNEVGIAGNSNVGFRIYFSTVGNLIGQVQIDNIQVNAVPEPRSLALVSLAGAGLVIWQLRRRRQA